MIINLDQFKAVFVTIVDHNLKPKVPMGGEVYYLGTFRARGHRLECIIF